MTAHRKRASGVREHTVGELLFQHRRENGRLALKRGIRRRQKATVRATRAVDAALLPSELGLIAQNGPFMPLLLPIFAGFAPDLIRYFVPLRNKANLLLAPFRSES